MLTTALFQTLMNVPRQATVATAAPPVRILLVRTHASVEVGLVETATPVQVHAAFEIYLLVRARLSNDVSQCVFT